MKVRCELFVVTQSFGYFCSGEDLERRAQWNFLMTADGSWAWQSSTPEGHVESSQTPFETLADCTADARARGYVMWNSEEERRRETDSVQSITKTAAGATSAK